MGGKHGSYKNCQEKSARDLKTIILYQYYRSSRKYTLIIVILIVYTIYIIYDRDTVYRKISLIVKKKGNFKGSASRSPSFFFSP